MGYTSYTAATILVNDLRAPELATAQQAGQHLEVILESLSSQTSVTPSVQRSIEIIRHLMSSTPPASGATTPHFPSAKRPRGDLSSSTDDSELPSWTFDAGAQGPGGFVGGAQPISAFGDHSALQLSEFLNVDFNGLPNMDLPLAPPILPAFPESGPLSWLGAAQDEDWLQGYDWLQQGGTGQ
jgi:hypothetical protein